MCCQGGFTLYMSIDLWDFNVFRTDTVFVLSDRTTPAANICSSTHCIVSEVVMCRTVGTLTLHYSNRFFSLVYYINVQFLSVLYGFKCNVFRLGALGILAKRKSDISALVQKRFHLPMTKTSQNCGHYHSAAKIIMTIISNLIKL